MELYPTLMDSSTINFTYVPKVSRLTKSLPKKMKNLPILSIQPDIEGNNNEFYDGRPKLIRRKSVHMVIDLSLLTSGFLSILLQL